MDTLNLLANGDIFQLQYNQIKKIFKNYSRAIVKKNQGVWIFIPHPSKPITLSISRYELGSMLDDMKADIFKSLSMQLGMNKDEAKKALAVFCP